jgi:Glycosyl hydrolase family 26
MYYFFLNASRLRLFKLYLIIFLFSSFAALAQDQSTLPIALRGTMIGAYTHGGVWSGMETFYQLEAALGKKMDIVHWYSSWNNEFEPKLVAAATEGGRLPMISWQSHDHSIDNMISGNYDDYIRRWAVATRDYGQSVYLRPFPEMNGFWTSWHGQPEKLVIAWRHIVDIFRAEGAHNVKWVWSPNITDEPNVESNFLERYYPGSDYVDILALDGYNWGNLRPYTVWKSFEEIFAEPYDRLVALGPQPIWIAELASTEHGGNKAEWINSMFASTAFPRIEALVWFNENKETDWRIDSSAEALQAFRNGLSVTLASQ